MLAGTAFENPLSAVTMPGQILSVNVSVAKPMLIDGRSILSAIDKQPVSRLDRPDRIAVTPLGLAGDEQADPTVHGGLNKAIYAYPHEHYPFWQTVRAQAKVAAWDEPAPHGLLGENLTITGLLEADAHVGDLLRFPDCVLAISEPRQPCYKFEARMFRQASKLMAQSGYCGFYLRVVQAGTMAAGEHYELEPGLREVSIREYFQLKMRKRDLP
jgi:MOSC domain-containing protein YiiM